MTAGGFGRKGLGGDSEMARRREAFIAAERARQANPSTVEASDPPPRFGFAGTAPVMASNRPLKSVGVAYLLWFVFGVLSAHRHYLGFHNSALAQTGLWLGGWLLFLGGNYYFLAAPFLAGLWVLADGFIIPTMCRDANARAGRPDMRQVFA